MPSLKDLKTRINSVKSTQKITKAMKMVAASKLRKARESAEAAAPYAQRMDRMLTSLAKNLASNDNAPKLLSGTGKDSTHLLVVVSTDRGLCGGLNTNLIKEVKQEVSSLRKNGKEIKLLCLGKKSYELLKREYSGHIVEKIEGLTRKAVNFSDAENQAEKIIEWFDNNQFDICTIFYNKFVSAISQQPVKQQIIPLNVDSSEGQPNQNSAVYEFEPNEEVISKTLLPRNITVQLFHALQENAASEHGARMSAMDNATRNAGDMIKKLTLVYNRTRQAAITKELIEIISGAEAI